MSLKSSTDRLALYEKVAELCAGPYGCAYSVRHKTSKQLCIMHVLKWDDLNAGSEEANDALKSHVLAEVELLVTHKHKHLATFVECFAASDVGKTLLATADDNTSTSVFAASSRLQRIRRCSTSLTSTRTRANG